MRRWRSKRSSKWNERSGLADRAPAGCTITPKGIVENTLLAADAAIARHFAIECDVQDTADGDVVVFHDYTLDRLTTEKGPVRKRAAAELTSLALAATQDRIPTLQTLLTRVAGRVPLVIEIKSWLDGDLTLTRRTAEIVSAYNGPVALKSFGPAVVAALRQLAPQVPRGIVAESQYDQPEWERLSREARHAMANLLHFPQTQPDFLSWHVGDLPAGAPFLCRHLAHIPVMTWTVRTADDRRRAAGHANQKVFEGFVPDA